MKAPLPEPEDEPVRREGDKVYVALPSTEQAEQIVHRVRKKLTELPALPRTTNPVAVVIAYELFGLSVDDIALAMGLSVTQINGIRQHDAYKVMREQILENIQQAGQEEVVEIFKKSRVSAANKIVTLIENPRPTVALSAAKVALEASGVKLTPEQKQTDPMKGGLTLVFIDGDKAGAVPDVDVIDG